jgi:hypothetical protein
MTDDDIRLSGQTWQKTKGHYGLPNFEASPR